ncbi:hypothetical protein DS884_11080 [Tenacibaculum sp. E3R01]|uniref:McrC family protein n=1 Tax=Tenacibaculum sp. E3R01 TaxID=2267227 RepID=UPI000DE814AC|nr:hypothetical protein [Tenacibaculum sp. E3R01]RBW57589.1 hypothetical protein DS884_11080 [Tenacibaculum sp. E3R01]
MELGVPNNHNYYEEDSLSEAYLMEQTGIRSKRKSRDLINNLFSSVFELKTGNSKLKKVQIIGFKNQKSKEEDNLILKLYTKENSENQKEYFIQSGLFSGVVYHKGCKFNITTRHGDVFLRRMLNFVNDIYVDTEKSKASKKEEHNEFQYIIAYLFIQSLEKASVLGLPKEYQSVIQRSHKVRGKIDLNAYLKRDIPFRGKLTTTYREQTYIQEICDVLYLALKKLEIKFGKDINNKLFSINQLLKQNYSGQYPNIETLQKAKNHRILHNPLYASFKKVIEYAEIILLDNDLSPKDNTLETTGYLFDISQLFEVYLEKLLSRHFKDWYVTGQEELKLYKGLFYNRKMFPDLVLKHKYSNKVIVFDAKFKTMQLETKQSKYSDLDRSDFYQIHTYIQYYQSDVIIGGLLYPLSKPLIKNKAYSNSLFGKEDSNTAKFIVDGVFVNENMNMEDLLNSENEFLDRIENLIDVSLNTKQKYLEVI